MVVMPGLIDAHVHLMHESEHTAPMYLAAGRYHGAGYGRSPGRRCGMAGGTSERNAQGPATVVLWSDYRSGATGPSCRHSDCRFSGIGAGNCRRDCRRRRLGHQDLRADPARAHPDDHRESPRTRIAGHRRPERHPRVGSHRRGDLWSRACIGRLPGPGTCRSTGGLRLLSRTRRGALAKGVEPRHGRGRCHGPHCPAPGSTVCRCRSVSRSDAGRDGAPGTPDRS